MAYLEALPRELLNIIYLKVCLVRNQQGALVPINRGTIDCSNLFATTLVSRSMNSFTRHMATGGNVFLLSGHETTFPLKEAADPRRYTYGRHNKWPIYASDEQAFTMSLPAMTMRQRVRSVRLCLSPPGAYDDLEFGWHDGHAVYANREDDWLAPVRQLRALGFIDLQTITIEITHQMYDDCFDSTLPKTDFGFEARAVAAINGIDLSSEQCTIEVVFKRR